MLKHMFYPFYPSLFCETKPLMIGKFFRNYKMFWQWSCWGQMWTVWLKKCSLLWVLSSLCTHGNVENEQQLVVVEVQYALVWIPSFFFSCLPCPTPPSHIKNDCFQGEWNLKLDTLALQKKNTKLCLNLHECLLCFLLPRTNIMIRQTKN